MKQYFLCAVFLLLSAGAIAQAVDERPAVEGEWGFRPVVDSTTARNPPSFTWRPQKDANSYTLQVARSESFDQIDYEASGITYNVHCPTRIFEEGEWYWRFRFTHKSNTTSEWSTTRQFNITPSAMKFVLPSKSEIIARVPDSHPRLFLRPEDVPDIKNRLSSIEGDVWTALVKRCDALLKSPPETAEPSKYPKGIQRGSDPWRAIWWGNRTYTIKLLDSAATLGFVYLTTGDTRYGEEARRLLLASAEWDPRGATGYRYNDEAGMPYAYHFSRTYTFINDLLSEEERERCRDIMTIRGNEMYNHLHPRHLWRPYSSHSNRAWHFLGEVGIAFHDEIPEADEWLWFAVNVFANVYPVWSDSDGGWHEGINYWSSYIGRFTWWADVMGRAIGINAYDLPYFSQAGYYAMYMLPPGTHGGGFGDLNARVNSVRLLPLMTVLAMQASNSHWQWYVDQEGGATWPNDYISLLRRTRTTLDTETPVLLPSSRLFKGTGQAVLNSNLIDANENIQIVFKSSPFGTQSHGYEAQNSFLISAFGEPLLIRSGLRDSYGSNHHRKWMWETKSVNNITVNGAGQTPHSTKATGSITRFHTTPQIDYVEGEAARAYGGHLNSFRRGILFIKPDLILVLDRLIAKEPSQFQWLLHAPKKMELEGDVIHIRNDKAACAIQILKPSDVTISYTDQFDPPPRPRVQLTQYHFTAETIEPSHTAEFLVVIRPHRFGDPHPPVGKLIQNDNDTWVLEAPLKDGHAVVKISKRGEESVDIEVSLWDSEGKNITRWSTVIEN